MIGHWLISGLLIWLAEECIRTAQEGRGVFIYYHKEVRFILMI